MSHILVYLVGDQRHGIPLEAVTRVAAAVEVTPLPNAPEAIVGAINVQGQVVSLLSLRLRHGLPDREVGLDDRLIIAQSFSRRVLALLVDAVEGVLEVEQHAMADMREIAEGAGKITGVVKLEDGLVLLDDIDDLASYDVAPPTRGVAGV